MYGDDCSPAIYEANPVSRRAVVAHQLVCQLFPLNNKARIRSNSHQTNAITEVVFDDALAQARELDRVFKETGQLKGPLHGIPITVKDQFSIKGVDSTLGYVGRSFSPATEDAVIVQMLKEMGAVILLKTNLPQSIMVRISAT